MTGFNRENLSLSIILCGALTLPGCVSPFQAHYQAATNRDGMCPGKDGLTPPQAEIRTGAKDWFPQTACEAAVIQAAVDRCIGAATTTSDVFGADSFATGAGWRWTRRRPARMAYSPRWGRWCRIRCSPPPIWWRRWEPPSPRPFMAPPPRYRSKACTPPPAITPSKTSGSPRMKPIIKACGTPSVRYARKICCWAVLKWKNPARLIRPRRVNGVPFVAVCAGSTPSPASSLDAAPRNRGCRLFNNRHAENRARIKHGLDFYVGFKFGRLRSTSIPLTLHRGYLLARFRLRCIEATCYLRLRYR